MTNKNPTAITYSYSLKLSFFIVLVGVVLLLLQRVAPALEFYAGLLIILLCAPGFMIGLMISLALSVRTSINSSDSTKIRIYRKEIVIHIVGLLFVVGFVLHFFSR